MPYSRIVFEKRLGDAFDHVAYTLDNLFKVLWKELKRDEVKSQDYWMNVNANPEERLTSLATTLIQRAKLQMQHDLSHAIGNKRAWIYVLNWNKKVAVGSLLYGDVAFPQVNLPAMDDQAVVTRRDNNKEFVFDDYGQLTGRYVYRFITSFDETTLKRGEGIKARDQNAGDDVYSHVAGKVKSRFVSTTRSTQPIQNAHGEVFGTKRVKIDLSRIPRQHIYDVSTPQGELELLKGKQGTYGTPNTYTGQVQQALKDAKRTKEVLVENEIPQDAIVETAAFTLNGIPRVDPQ